MLLPPFVLLLLLLLVELATKTLALALTVRAVEFLTTVYLQGLLEFAQVYIALLDLVHERGGTRARE